MANEWQPPTGGGQPPHGQPGQPGYGQPQPGYGQPGYGQPQAGYDQGQNTVIQGQQQQQWPTQQHAAAPEPPKKSRVGLIAMVLVLVAGLATAGALVFVNRSDDGQTADEATYVIMDQPAVSSEPVFQSRDERGPDPFFPLEVQLVAFMAEEGQGGGGDGGDGDDGGEDDDSSDSGGSTVTPAFIADELEEDIKTGLYGGTAENTCDPERLISFLTENPDIGAAWAQVQGITFAEMPSYIRSLRVEVLAAPVSVINHGFDDTTKSAYEINSVLDAGTAVLVDENGDIRTRCYCGNPITPPPPPPYKPPACLIFPATVFVEPGSNKQRFNAPQNVRLTNRVAEYRDQAYVEIMWGTGADEMGWTPVANASVERFCRPPLAEPKCPTATGAPIFRTATAEQAFGQLGIGDSPSTSILPGQVKPVGQDGARVISNGRVLIRFSHPSRTATSAWINQADIDETTTAADCMPERACVQLSGATVTTPMPPTPTVTPGFHRVEFAGHAVGLGLEETGIAEDTSIELRLLDQGGVSFWNHLSDLEFVDDAECTSTPVSLCKRASNQTRDNLVLRNPTTNPVDGLMNVDANIFTFDEITQWANVEDPIDITNVVGYAGNVPVTLIETAAPTNGLVQVQVAGTGPVGWIPLSTLNGDACVPREACAAMTQAMHTNFKDSGPVVPGTPSAGTLTVKQWQAAAFDWPEEATTLADIGVSATIERLHILMEVEGGQGWVPWEATWFGAAECEPPPPPTCPPAFVATTANSGPACCVEGPYGPSLVTFTGQTRPGPNGDLIEVEADFGLFWFDATTQSPNPDACDETPVTSCPPIANGTSVINEEAPDVCCVQLGSGENTSFVEAVLTGDTAELGGATYWAIAGGDPVPATAFVSADECVGEPECPDENERLVAGECQLVDCPDGQQLVENDCEDLPTCPDGQELTEGGCEDVQVECPTGQELLADGTCRVPPPTCGSGERLVNGRCEPVPSCPAGQELLADGSCRTAQILCPEGQRPENGECVQIPEVGCPAGSFDAGDNVCCPNGSERIPGTSNCQIVCTADEVFNATTNQCDPKPCPFGQITFGGECCIEPKVPNDFTGQCVDLCPDGSRPDSLNGQCISSCTTTFDNQGRCCPAGETVVNGVCAPPTAECPSPRVIAPINGECCPAGEGIDLGGYCDGGCPASMQTSIGCCFEGEVPNANQTDCIPSTPQCPSDSEWAPVDQECCPIYNPNTPSEILNGRCEYFA